MCEENVFAVYFARFFGALLLLPLGRGSARVLSPAVFALGLALLVQRDWGAWANVDITTVTVEFVMGAAFALPLSLSLATVRMVGTIIASARGVNLSSFYTTSGRQSVALAELAALYMWIYLLDSRAVEELLLFLAGYPMSCRLSSFDVEALLDLPIVIFNLLGLTLKSVWQFCLPLLYLFILVEMGMAFINRLVPQVGMYSGTFQLKTLLSLIFLWLLAQSGYLHLPLNATLGELKSSIWVS